MKNLFAILLIATLSILASCEGEKSSVQPNLNEAKAALYQLATLQERFYLSNEIYTNEMTQPEFTTDPYVTAYGAYTIDIVPGADNNNYLGIATYNGADAETQECQWFLIDGLGNKTSGPSSDCWIR